MWVSTDKSFSVNEIIVIIVVLLLRLMANTFLNFWLLAIVNKRLSLLVHSWPMLQDYFPQSTERGMVTVHHQIYHYGSSEHPNLWSGATGEPSHGGCEVEAIWFRLWLY